MGNTATKKNVLALDDISINLVTIKHVLSDIFNVRAVKSAELALSIIDSVNIDVIILNMEMTNMESIVFLSDINKNPKTTDIPVIGIISQTNFSSMANAIRNGVVDYIFKPLNQAVLREKIIKILELHIPM